MLFRKSKKKFFQIPPKIILPQADLKLHSSPQSRLYPGLELKVKLKFLFFSRVKTKLFDISSGGEYNLTWTVVSLAPVVQYHLQYRQIQVRKLFSLKTLLQESPFGEEGGWRRAVMPEDRLPR